MARCTTCFYPGLPHAFAYQASAETTRLAGEIRTFLESARGWRPMKRLARFVAYAVAVVVVLAASAVRRLGEWRSRRSHLGRRGGRVPRDPGVDRRSSRTRCTSAPARRSPGWLERVLARPLGDARTWTARSARCAWSSPTDMTATVNAHMAYKYGVADMLVGALLSRVATQSRCGWWGGLLRGVHPSRSPAEGSRWTTRPIAATASMDVAR